MASIDDLSDELLTKIFSLLGPKDCFAASCVQQSWKARARDDSIWSERCRKMWLVTERKDHHRHDMPSFMATYYCWDKELGKYGALAGRAHIAWHKIEKFCQEHHPKMLLTLRPGASEKDLDEAETNLNHAFPEAFRVLYRFHDGQTWGSMARYNGLFGWYAVERANFFHHCTAMLPIAIVATAYMNHGDMALAFFGGDTLNLRAMIHKFWGIDFLSRNICMDVKTGSVYVMCSTRMEPAVQRPGGGGILEWFEAYADALNSGYFKVACHIGCDTAGISLIPRAPPGQVSTITRGVRASASVVYLPHLDVSGGEYDFGYRMTFELLSEDEQRMAWPQSAGPFRPLSSLEMYLRRYVFRNAAGQVKQVIEFNMFIGDKLTFSNPSFENSSVMHQEEPEGSMEAHLRVVEGSKAQPTGPGFDLQCPSFRFCAPDYMF